MYFRNTFRSLKLRKKFKVIYLEFKEFLLHKILQVSEFPQSIQTMFFMYSGFHYIVNIFPYANTPLHTHIQRKKLQPRTTNFLIF